MSSNSSIALGVLRLVHIMVKAAVKPAKATKSKHISIGKNGAMREMLAKASRSNGRGY